MDDESSSIRSTKNDEGRLVNVCVHKGLIRTRRRRTSGLVQYADVRDVGKAAKDWPQLNFVIYHSGFRFTAVNEQRLGAVEKTRVDWVTDLAEIPAKYGVKNVYGDSAIFRARARWPSRVSAPP